jgi:hypothetical protein
MLVLAHEDGDIIESKHVVTIQKIAHVDYRTVHLLVSQQFSHFIVVH